MKGGIWIDADSEPLGCVLVVVLEVKTFLLLFRFALAILWVGNGNQLNSLKLALEKFVKSHEVNLFLAGFSHLDSLCALTETALQQQWLKMLCFGSNYPRLNLLKKPPDFWHHMGPHSTCLVLEMISSIQVYFPKKVMIERKPVSLLHSVELTFWRVFHKWIWFFTCCPRSWIS